MFGRRSSLVRPHTQHPQIGRTERPATVVAAAESDSANGALAGKDTTESPGGMAPSRKSNGALTNGHDRIDSDGTGSSVNGGDAGTKRAPHVRSPSTAGTSTPHSKRLSSFFANGSPKSEMPKPILTPINGHFDRKELSLNAEEHGAHLSKLDMTSGGNSSLARAGEPSHADEPSGTFPVHNTSLRPVDVLNETPVAAQVLAAEQMDLETKRQMEFGPLLSPRHKCISQFPKGYEVPNAVEDALSYFGLVTTYLSYLILIVFGHVRDFFGKRFKSRDFDYLREQNGYAPLFSDFDSFYLRRLKLRLNDAFHRPTTGVPGRTIVVLDRVSHDFNHHFHLTGTTTRCLNMSSYNYLGFAQSEGQCSEAVKEAVLKYGLSSGGSPTEGGTSDLYCAVREKVANFIGKPAACIYSQGFGTNATLFPALASKNCLIISDELNHTSIRFGTRLSGAYLRVFKHNDMQALENLLRESIAQGQPRTHRPWKKIFVLVEGLYSMEGDFCNLPALVKLKDKYKFYLYVDEAHSVGAVGPNSRGVCDYFGVDPARVDILMGTFTKSFGAAGGYVGADVQTIRRLEMYNAGNFFAEAPSPIILQQIMTSLCSISGEIPGSDGPLRVQRLSFNSRYLRLGLKRLGFIVYGHDDSPVIPLLLYHPGKMHAFSYEMMRRKIAVVVVGYPATPLLTSRVRLCVSAAHNKQDLDHLLAACDEIGTLMGLKVSSGAAGEEVGPKQLEFLKLGEKRPIHPPRWPLAKVLRECEEDVIY